MKTTAYILGTLGTFLALFASGFYTLFTETVRVKEFWAGILLLIFAILGASSIFLFRKNPQAARRNFLIAGLGGIVGFLFLAGLSSAIVEGNYFRVMFVDLGGYSLFLLAGVLVKKSIDRK